MSNDSILYETYLLKRYRDMFGLGSLQVNNISNNTILSGNTSVLTDFYVPTNTTINMNASIGTFLYVNDSLNVSVRDGLVLINPIDLEKQEIQKDNQYTQSSDGKIQLKAINAFDENWLWLIIIDFQQYKPCR